MLLRGPEEVEENRSGKTSRVDRRSMSAWEGLERKVCLTSAGIWNYTETTILLNPIHSETE
ncbi:hypothetical protein DHD08_02700 [Arenibacter sp. H213]|nr:hypothetical protein [Arenibacter sp. H213]